MLPNQPADKTVAASNTRLERTRHNGIFIRSNLGEPLKRSVRRLRKLHRLNLMMNERVSVELTSSEAIVLLEFLSRFSDKNILRIEDQAEERVLWDLCASLESILAEPFAHNYDELLAQARGQVRDAVS